MPHLALLEGGYLKTTEDFLRTLHGVTSVSVLRCDDVMTAFINTDPTCFWNEDSIKVACARELGRACVPGRIVMRTEMRYAA